MNFQPSGSNVPTGYQKDTGAGYSASRGYGWDHTIGTRDRNKNTDHRLDTFIVSEGATWRYNLPNGTYFVSLAIGDAGYAAGPHRVLVEGHTCHSGYLHKGERVHHRHRGPRNGH